MCVCVYISWFFFFNSNADGEWRPHKEPTTEKSRTESPETLYAFFLFPRRDNLASVWGGAPPLVLPGCTALGSPCGPAVCPRGDPSWRAVLTARSPGPGPSSQPLLPHHTPGSWLTPAPVNPPGSSKPQRVCAGQELGSLSLTSLHTSIRVRVIGFWRKTGSYLTILVVMLPECLRKARNLDFCVKSLNL